MKIEVYTPQNQDIEHDGFGAVLLNHLGSTVSQDTGRDAQALANGLGLPVVAADRPGTAGLIPHRALAVQLSTPSGYVEESAKLGKRIDRQLDRLGIDRSIILGRSAGGLGALALTRAETISSQRAVFAVEPVAMESMTVAEGKRRFQDYNEAQKRLQHDESQSGIIRPNNGTLPTLQAASRLASIPPSFMYDQYHNSDIWATNASLQYAEHIADHQPGIDATLEFAEHSLVATDEVSARDVARLIFTRNGFHVERTQNTTHASYDDHAFMLNRVQPVVDRMVSEVK